MEADEVDHVTPHYPEFSIKSFSGCSKCTRFVARCFIYVLIMDEDNAGRTCSLVLTKPNKSCGLLAPGVDLSQIIGHGFFWKLLINILHLFDFVEF